MTLDGAHVTGPRPGLAVVFQEYGRSLFPWMRVAENDELPLRQRRSTPKAARRARVPDLEDLVRGLWRERGMAVLSVTHDIDEAV